MFPVRPPAGTRRPALAAGAARAVRRQPTGSELGPPCPALRANPFPEICTDGRSARARAPGFAATAAPSYSSGPRTCPDGRVSAQLGTVTRLPVHPASPVLLTKNGPLGALDSLARLNEAAAPSYLFKVCSHSNPSQKIKVGRRCNPQGDPANQLPYALLVYWPVDSHTCQTPWSVFQDGPNGEPAGRCQERADAEARREARAANHDCGNDVSTGITTARAWAAAAIRIGPRPESIGGPAVAVPHPTGAHPPRGATGSGHDGALTLSGALFQGTWARSAAEDASPDYNSETPVRAPDSQAGLFPVRSPLLGESLVRFAGRRRKVPTCRRGRGGDERPPPPVGCNQFAGRSAVQVQWTSRDVAGSEPPTSPRSEHFTGPFNR
uniref:Uncharacterized protein n=1 Tax=Quercus lobata TaxID=97700 RepID=A0A7N2KRA4_QUELO